MIGKSHYCTSCKGQHTGLMKCDNCGQELNEPCKSRCIICNMELI